MSDQVHIDALTKWFVSDCEILTSLATEHATKLVGGGISTIQRLAKKVMKDPDFLSSVGISQDDSEEIMIALRRYCVIYLLCLN